MIVSSIKHPSWFSPKKLLVIFCVINLINYVDRGAIASNGVNGSAGTCTEGGTCTSGTGIQEIHSMLPSFSGFSIQVSLGDFDLSNFEDGCLSSAFMVGLLVASPIFASWAKSVNPFRLIGVGLSVWTVAVAGCGISFNFWSITICRMLVGVGEASFISLAAPFIDDNAPAAQKTVWLSIFYMCIPSGYALGYVYGGLVGSYSNWRFAFWGEAILMLPFAILGFIMKPLQLKAIHVDNYFWVTWSLCGLLGFTRRLGFMPAESKHVMTGWETGGPEVQDSGVLNGKDGSLKRDVKYSTINEQKGMNFASKIKVQISRFTKDIRVLLVEKVYVVNVLGYIAYNFVIGVYSYWGPKAGYNIYNMTDADLIFGGITIVCGILGTVAGGLLLDFMTSSIPNAFKLLSAATFLGGIFCFSAFCFSNMYAFLAMFSVGELLVFATQGPVNYICLHCVEPSMRPLAMAMSTVSIHLFGDVPSSPLVGVLQDYINNWRATALILTSIFIPAAGIWFSGIFLPSVDRFHQDSDQISTAPLLEGTKTKATESAAEP